MEAAVSSWSPTTTVTRISGRRRLPRITSGLPTLSSSPATMPTTVKAGLDRYDHIYGCLSATDGVVAD